MMMGMAALKATAMASKVVAMATKASCSAGAQMA